MWVGAWVGYLVLRQPQNDPPPQAVSKGLISALRPGGYRPTAAAHLPPALDRTRCPGCRTPNRQSLCTSGGIVFLWYPQAAAAARP